MRLAVIVPTLNPRLEEISDLVEAVRGQIGEKVWINFIDSSSDDTEFYQLADDVHRIEKREFNHGATRNLGASLVPESCSVLIFMTQDAVPVGQHWLQDLTQPILSGEAQATFARQLPKLDATLLEAFARYFNYPSFSSLKRGGNVDMANVKTFFFSSVCSAIDKEIFWKTEGFPSDVIMNEDMALAAKILGGGYAIKYVAEAAVRHSHTYSLRQQFRRNFDVGAFFAEAKGELGQVKTAGEGLRFVVGQIRYAARHNALHLLPSILLEAAAKFTGFQLGKRHRLLHVGLKRRLSMHSYHWSQEKA